MLNHPQYKFMSATYFPCTFEGHQHSVTLLWCYPEDNKSAILTDHQQQLITFNNADELKNHPINQFISIKYDKYDILNFEQSFNLAQQLVAYERISTTTCDILLTTANMLEDILKGLNLHNHDKYHKNFHYILDKFLFGEHTPVLAPPEGEELYNAVLSRYEVKCLKRHFRQHYRRIAQHIPALAPIFMTTQAPHQTQTSTV